ncbi:hypothetical protein D4758_19470 [Enterocloster citroniae]|nr:hypothetical protein [Enterocloster citroniae]
MNIVFSIILVKPFGIAGVVIATALSRIFTTVWFDPYLVFKHAFSKGTRRYWATYFLYIFVIASAVCLTNLVFTLFKLNSGSIVIFVTKTVISIVLCSIVMLLGTVWMKETKMIFKMILGEKK